MALWGDCREFDFDDTTLETWKQFIPEETYVIREKSKEIVIEKRVKIQYGGLDNKKVVRKFNSAEYGFIALDQAEEIEEEKLTELRLTLRRSIKGQHLPFKELYTANPADCWLKYEFVSGHDKRFIFLPSLPSDNSFLPDSYVPNMEYTLRNRPELLKAYRDGSWEILAGADLIIQDRWVDRANLCKFHKSHRRIITCDPAAFGDDETVIYCMDNTRIKNKRIYGQKDAVHTANEMEMLGLDFKPSLYVVDSLGVGHGVAAILSSKGLPVLEIVASEAQKSGVPDKFVNRRAQIWWYAGNQFGDNEVELHYKDEELKRQLSVPRYKFKGDKFLVEDNANIKKRYGRSLDRASAYVQGLWGLQYAEEEEEDKSELQFGEGFKEDFLGFMSS